MPFPSPPPKKPEEVHQHNSVTIQSHKHIVKFKHPNSSEVLEGVFRCFLHDGRKCLQMYLILPIVLKRCFICGCCFW